MTEMNKNVGKELRKLCETDAEVAAVLYASRKHSGAAGKQPPRASASTC